MTQPLFLVGAGFNADASHEAGTISGNSICIGTHKIDCGYPLVSDAARLCFGLAEVPKDKSIEDLFSESLERGDDSPVQNLAYLLMKADYYLAFRLASAEAPNCYKDFFEEFAETHFLTFNYDSLIETFLFRSRNWYPHDGFGLKVDARLQPEASDLGNQTSKFNGRHGPPEATTAPN